MTGKVMQPSEIMYAISANYDLRNRIEALVRSRWWNNPPADPTRWVPLGDLAWAVATNVTILSGVTAALDGGNGATLDVAIDGISEGDLTFVVYEGIDRIDALTLDVPDVPQA